jgi:hypothetical protein
MAADLAAMERLAAHWDARGVAPDDRLLSVYTSALDIAADTQSPEPVGSLIHALGPENRAAFTEQVARREVAAVSTIAPDYSGWEGWLLRANWPFFERLFANYEPLARTDQQVLWVPSNGARPIADARCNVDAISPGKIRVAVLADTTGIASVSLERSGDFATGRTALLTVTEESPITGSVSEPPWSGFPRYGIANEPELMLAAPVVAGERTSLVLENLDGSAIGNAACDAKLLQAPGYAVLPGLPEGVERYIAGARP